MKFELYLETYGTTKCVRCGEPFTKENPCYNDDGNNESMSGVFNPETLHIDGTCSKCETPKEIAHGVVEVTPSNFRLNI